MGGVEIMPKILIIDDDPDIVQAMRIVLESKQYQVVVAESGKEGLRKAKLEKPDLVILDIMMETCGKGFDVARDLKNDREHRNTPILMLTAMKEKTGLSFEKEAGDPDWLPVDEYCDKPLNPEELILKVEALLGKR
jgi:CheY-like chemotaxis protein